jgi:hypothetical protein
MGLFREYFRHLLSLDYSPDKYAFPPPKAAAKAKPAPVVDNGFRFKFAHPVEGQRAAYFSRDTVREDGVIESEYRRGGAAAAKAFTDEITAADRLHLRGLDPTKAQVIKPLWVGGLSARKAAGLLAEDHGRGYAQRTVENYFAAFNAASEPAATLSPTDERG